MSTLSIQAQAALTKLGSATLASTGTALAVDGTTAYVLTASAGQQQVHLFDVSVPATPRYKSSLTLLPTTNLPPLPFRHAVVSNGTLYITSYPTSATTPHSVVALAIDVRNPTSPSVLGSFSNAGGDEMLLAASGDYMYAVMANSSSLNVYNRTQTYSSYLTSQRTVNLPYSLSGILSLSVSGNTVYVQYGNGVFSTLDITNPANPVSSSGTTAGTVSAASGALAAGLAQPLYAGSVPSNTLRLYSLSSPLQPVLIHSLPGSYGTQVAVSGQSVFTIGATSPYITAAASSSQPLRGYYLPANGTAPIAAVDAISQGANALVAANNLAYVLTDTSLGIYAFPATVLATQPAAPQTALSIYPNPASGTVHIPQLTRGETITIYDMVGRVCLQATPLASGTIDVSALQKGLYQVRAGASMGKLTIQ
jgi:hypothetical protein